MGPIGGLYTGLKMAAGLPILYLSCDIPRIYPEVLAHLIREQEGQKAIVPSIKGRVNPLCAIYHPACQARVVDALYSNDRSIMAFLRHIDCKSVELDGLFDADTLTSINTPQELKQLTEEHAG